MAKWSTMLALMTGVAVATGEAVSPIQKVLQMMEQMKSKGIAEKKAEDVRYSAFSQWCGDTEKVKVKSIDQAAADIESLNAAIGQATADIQVLGERVAELEEDVGRWETDMKAATSVREMERTDYAATHAEYEATVDAVERSVGVLRQQGKIPQKELLQLRLLTEHERSSLTSLIQESSAKQDPSDPSGHLSKRNPQANAYEAQSGGILAMLQELRARFVGEKTDLEKEEMAARHAYEKIMQRLTDQKKLAEQEIGQKKVKSAEVAGEKATAEGDLAETQKIKAEDEKYLSEMKAMCSMKAEDFANRQELRTGELEAIDKAIEIIGGVANADTAGASHGGSALAQIRSQVPNTGRMPGLVQAAALLRQRAAATGSKVLAMAAAKAEEDPFGKVKKMIQDLLVKLMEEQASEADHNAWCSAELATNKQTRQNKAESVDALAAEVDKLTAEGARLAQEISDLNDGILELDAGIAKATEDRAEEKEANAATMKDAEESQTAVAQALAVLRDFYAKAAQATSLAQQSPMEDAPETFDSAYTGQQGESTGVVGMLEVIESDFARLRATTDAAESQAAADYKTFIADSKQDKAIKEAEVEHKTSKQHTNEQMQASTKKSLEQTQVELDAALTYFEKLKPDCVDSGITYEDRVRRRKEELESLQDAYKILAGEDVPSFQDMKAEQLD